MARKQTGKEELLVPTVYDWRTTDEEEIERRRLRAQTETFRILNRDPHHPIFSNFEVLSGSGLTYSVEIRRLRERQVACTCVDFRINGLGTCKHVEAVFLLLEGRFRKAFQLALEVGSDRLDLFPDPATGRWRMEGDRRRLPKVLRQRIDPDGWLLGEPSEDEIKAWRKLSQNGCPSLRVSQEADSWLERRCREEERHRLRREYEAKVHSGEWPSHETTVPLYPYQREGMLHLAFTERAMLADEMGLGKTIQAIAACALLHRLGKAERVLVVTPASLKTEWEEQVQRFTNLSLQLVFGPQKQRLKAYRNAPFFTVVNYEQMLADALEVNEHLHPDVVVLDEAQRIKNWNTKTARAIKRLRSRYAFVLTGTPIENRIDELHSLIDFLDPAVLGPLFRFNREYYVLDDRGRPDGYRNLQQLHDRIRPLMVRRRKADVETELPDRTDKHLFVPLSPSQAVNYEEHIVIIGRLLQAARRRALTQGEQEKLFKHLAMARMTCDTNYILDRTDRTCPKLGELEKLLEAARDNGAKVIVFSEWEGMLELVRDLCKRMNLGYAWHTGSVPQRRRRAEINAFKGDANCRVFLSTDSGSTGLNLQNASVVINCDLPWNPARLEQRIARAWRKHQTQPVTVYHLIAEKTIEQQMLETLAGKQALADGVLDLRGDLAELKPRGGRQAFLARLRQLFTQRQDGETTPPPPRGPSLPADRSLGFAETVHQRINGALVQCEERFPKEGAHSVLYVVVERDAGVHRERLASLHQEYFGEGRADPLAPVRLEVVDRATHDALERLAAAGLICATTRGARPLFPGGDPAAKALTDEERRRLAEQAGWAQRQARLARVLGAAGFVAEARDKALEALVAGARAVAVAGRLPEPGSPEEALQAPVATAWGAGLEPLRAFQQTAAGPWEPAVAEIERVAKELTAQAGVKA
ncbi:MAG: DEAD/DEAH box helicase [Verrucomicrobiae bacterium]|nr:DEAD/DEAH box helicase [Verrucomicrobiae bacterium]